MILTVKIGMALVSEKKIQGNVHERKILVNEAQRLYTHK